MFIIIYYTRYYYLSILEDIRTNEPESIFSYSIIIYLIQYLNIITIFKKFYFVLNLNFVNYIITSIFILYYVVK